MKRGFTMIEMILVMSIIVVIFLLTLPNIQKTLSVVNDKGCDAQLKIVDAAILQYMIKNDTTPGSIHDLIGEGYLSERQQFCSDGSQISISNGQASR